LKLNNIAMIGIEILIKFFCQKYRILDDGKAITSSASHKKRPSLKERPFQIIGKANYLPKP